MAQIASVADVMRMLNVTTLPSGQTSRLEAFLEAAEEWVQRAYKRNWTATGTVTEDHYNVRQGALIHLRDDMPLAPVVVTVFVIDNTDAILGRVLTEGTSFQLLDRGRLQLFFFPNDIAISGLQGGSADAAPQERLPIHYKTVRVSYSASEMVPKPVRDAVALIAASSYSQSQNEVSGFRREKIGEYEYERADPSSDTFGSLVIPARARSFLAPYSGKRGVRST